MKTTRVPKENATTAGLLCPTCIARRLWYPFMESPVRHYRENESTVVK